MWRVMRLIVVLTIGLAPARTAEGQTGNESDWRRWSGMERIGKTDDELRTEGRRRAEAEYRDGWAEIEIFGLWIGSVYVDEELGLYRRLRGCVILNRADVESDGYNERIRELVASSGPPRKARGLRERFNRLQKLMDRKPVLAWLPVTWPKKGAKSVPTKVGPYEVVAEVVPNPVDVEVIRFMRESGIDFPPTVSRIRIKQGEKTVAEGQPVAATLLPELDVLIIKSPGRVHMLTFFDLRHGRVMWRYPGLGEILKRFLDAQPKSNMTWNQNHDRHGKIGRLEPSAVHTGDMTTPNEPVR